MRRRLSLVCAVTALAALAALAPAAPAIADPVFPVCGQVDPAPQMFADPTYVWLCIGGETGVHDPLQGPYCNAATGACYFIVTAGSDGAADVDAQLCATWGGQQPLCVTADTGTIPLLRIEPTRICYGWSPWMPPCYREVDEQ
jgi:hypothetical protein